MDDMRLEPGTVLADKYRLESVLGVGGMGTVYRAEHLALKAPVAIKVIDREVTEGDVALTRFMNEAQAAASLRSPHVVQILDYGTDGDRPFMVMEMLEGEDLATRLKRVGRLTPEQTYRIISHVAKAVAKAHESDIIHRDLKPDNVFLVHNEGDEIAKVLDFGVAKVEATALDGEGHTRTGSLLGTPYYMSPEQAQGNKDIDARSDLWTLGVIAFECLTGKRPFSSDGLGDLVLQICIRDIPKPSDRASVPLQFDAWFSRACEREPEERFQTARELAEDLHAALGIGGEPGSIPESRWSKAVVPPSDRATPTRQTGTLTTQPDHARNPREDSDTEDERSTEVDTAEEPAEEPAEETTTRDKFAGRDGSKWEVLPRDAAPEPDVENSAEERTRGRSSIALIALLALLVGGAMVFGLKQAGIDFEGTKKISGPRTSGPVQLKRPTQKETTTTGSDGRNQPNDSVGEGSTQGDEAEPPDPQKLDDDPDSSLEDPTGDPEEAAANEAPPSEGDSLSEIEKAAEAALEEREREASETPPKSAVEAPGQDRKEANGPQPTLPDSLTPAPPPPGE